MTPSDLAALQAENAELRKQVEELSRQLVEFDKLHELYGERPTPAALLKALVQSKAKAEHPLSITTFESVARELEDALEEAFGWVDVSVALGDPYRSIFASLPQSLERAIELELDDQNRVTGIAGEQPFRAKGPPITAVVSHRDWEIIQAERQPTASESTPVPPRKE